MTKNPRVASFEGQILSLAGMAGFEESACVARDMIDGATNALIRIDGAQATAEFTFKLSDRVVERIRGETPRPAVIESNLPPKQVPQNHHLHWWLVYLFGWVCGAGVMFVVVRGGV